MSRIGKKPIEIPEGVTVEITGNKIIVKGTKGELAYDVRPEIALEQKDSTIIASVKKDTKDSAAYWGTTRALIANMIEGVINGFEKKLRLIGVGYRVKKESDSKISMTLGFSHPVLFEAPEGVTFNVEGQDQLTVKGIDKQLVGLTASKIRKLKKPEPYKGKGIRYEGEVVRRKPGKAGKVI